jgi:hypothetical protein
MIIAAVPVLIHDKEWLVKGTLRDQLAIPVRGQGEPDPLPHFFVVKSGIADMTTKTRYFPFEVPTVF